MRAPRQGPQERMGGNTPTSPSSYPAFSYQGLPLDEPGWNEGQRGWSARAQTQAKIASPGWGASGKSPAHLLPLLPSPGLEHLENRNHHLPGPCKIHTEDRPLSPCSLLDLQLAGDRCAGQGMIPFCSV